MTALRRSPGAGPAHCGAKSHGLDGGSDLVNTNDRRSAHHRNGDAGKRSSLTVLRLVDSQDAADELLSRSPDQNRLAQGDESVEVTQDH